MRRGYTIAGVLAVILTGSAQAQDIPSYAPAPDADADFKWSGLYLGMGVTGAAQDYDFSGNPSRGAPGFSLSHGLFAGEVVLGKNLQLFSAVLGLEASGGKYGFSGNGTGDLSGLFSGAPADVPFDYDSSGYTGSLDARLGILLRPTILFYGSAGATALYSDDATSFSYDDPVSGERKTEKLEHFGNVFGTVGAGVEVALADFVTADVEYQYAFSASGWLEDRIPELDGLSASGHAVRAQMLFHF